jgi:hypothetical protein
MVSTGQLSQFARFIAKERRVRTSFAYSGADIAVGVKMLMWRAAWRTRGSLG